MKKIPAGCLYWSSTVRLLEPRIHPKDMPGGKEFFTAETLEFAEKRIENSAFSASLEILFCGYDSPGNSWQVLSS